MLDPKQRTLLLEALRPPAGYQLDLAVGTTFTLDLMTLLTAPLAFTFFDWEDQEGRPTADPNALLEAIRRHADRIHIFCEIGQIAVPPRDQLLLAYLEPCVHEVRAPREGGLFHPKIWLLRYSEGSKPPQYRLLCASRNLTFDRAWDTLVVLDGSPGEGVQPRNQPLVRFIESLPGLTVRELPGETAEAIKSLAREVSRAVFVAPDGVDELRFWPLGLPGLPSWPFPQRSDRGLVMSPFLGAELLARLCASGEQTLVSRLEALDTIGAAQLNGYKAYAFSDGADLEPETEAEDVGGLMEGNNILTGLHAKLFAFDTDGQGRVWTGSANATQAAFSQNVEFLVELRGDSGRIGVEAILQAPEKGRSVLLDLLEHYTPRTEPVSVEEETGLARALTRLRHALVDAELSVVASTGSEGERFDMEVRAGAPFDIGDLPAKLRIWPITLPREASAQACEWQDRRLVPVHFRHVSFTALTSFFAFEVEIALGDRKHESRFVLNLPASGFPQNRRERLLRHLLKSPEQVMRYLLLLLAADGALSVEDFGQVGKGRWGNGKSFQPNLPMLESLVQTLYRDPGKLDQVANFLAELSSTEEGRQLLPDDLDLIWQPIWQAREALRNGG